MLIRQLCSNSGESKQIVVIILNLVGEEFFMPFSDNVVAAVIYEHVRGEQRFGIVPDNSGREAVISCFSVAVTIVHTDDFDSV